MDVWLRGLAAAAIGGAAQAITLIIVDPHTFNDWGKLVTAAGASAVVAVAFYLVRSPLPEFPTRQDPPKR